nr:MAG TPA: hypothetical protein [Bacteriophage sp.]
MPLSPLYNESSHYYISVYVLFHYHSLRNKKFLQVFVNNL